MSQDTSARSRRAADQGGDLSGELLMRVADGDTTAFGELYDVLAPRAFGLARRVLRDPGLAEEVTQEAMVELWRTATRYDPTRGSITSWMLTIAHRRAIDRVRAESAARRRERTLGQTVEVDFDTVSETATRRDEIEQVRRCLSQLTAIQSETLSLAYCDGHTYREVALLLDIALSAVKARMRGALHRLRDCLMPDPQP